MPALNKVTTTVDDGLKTSTFVMYINDSATLDEIQTIVEEVLELIAPLLEGVITSSSLTRSLVLPTAVVTATLSPLADVESIGQFKFLSTNTTPYWLNLPTFSEEYLETEADVIDLTDPEVSALITYIETPNADNTVLRSYGDDIEPAILTLVSTSQEWRPRRKRSLRR